MRRLVTLALVLAPSSLLTSVAAAGDDPEPLVRAARYPLHGTVDPARSGAVETRRAPDGHLWVKPLVDGKEIGWFMFDTGKTGMSIEPSVAEAHGIPVVGEAELYGIGGVSKGQRFRMKSFELGPFRAEGLEAETMIPMRMPPGEERPVGVVGSWVLRDLVTEIDLTKNTIALHAPASYRRSGVNWLPTKMRPDVPAVQVKVEGQPIWLLVDTGMPGAISLFDPATAERLRLIAKEGGPRIQAVGSDGRPLDLRFMSARKVDFAGEARENVTIAVPASAMAPARPALQGLLGNRMLDGRTVVIDGPRKRVGLIES